MFFEPQIWEKKEVVTLSSLCTVTATDTYANELLTRLVAEWGKPPGTIETIVCSDTLPAFYSLNDRGEGYAIEITEKQVILYGETVPARIYAAVTLLQMCNHGELFTGSLCDAPDCAFRAYRAYLPGRNSMQEFYDMVDTIVYYKFNAISLEIGGAMEYKKHPEINETWRAFSADMRSHSGRAQEIQNVHGWSKNSIHADNADGDILTQDEVREIVAYCRSRGLEIYPEVPTLSHSDYICLAHPELREREEDPYPDAYCPNHPDTYPLVFDLLSEIIEVFEPKVVNIGHDELYTVCRCERCRDLRPEDVYTKDIVTLHDWLAERGIRTMMWGDKLLPVILPTGKNYGGAGGIRYRDGVALEPHPVLFYCQTMLPKDIVMLHWYYPFGIEYDYVFHRNGFPMVYGNLKAYLVDHWRQRRQMGAKGGAVSNWGSNAPIYMQRNTQYFNIAFAAFAMWSSTYDDDRRIEVWQKVFFECFHRKYGNLSDKPYLTVTHTTDMLLTYHGFVDGIFIEPEIYHMGQYRLRYTDGTETYFDVTYGENISGSKIPCAFGSNPMEFDPDTLCDSALNEVSYSTVPLSVDGVTYYKTAFLNPHPDKEIESLTYVPRKDFAVTVRSADYNGKSITIQ